MMPVPFDKTVTLYHKLITAEGITWQRQVIQGVYHRVQHKEITNGNSRAVTTIHKLMIPSKVFNALSCGDIVIEGNCTVDIPTNSSGNSIIAMGGWKVTTVKDNRYSDCGVSHVYGSDE